MFRTLLVTLGLLFVAPAAAERYYPLTVYTPPINNMTVYVPKQTYSLPEDSSTTGMYPALSSTTGEKYGYLRGTKIAAVHK
jgi:hypothetical protein